MLKKLTFLLFTVCMVAVVSLSTTTEPTTTKRTEAQNLVSIQVTGTTIDLVPKRIDVITTSPEVEIRKIVAAGGKKNKRDVPNAVFFRGILYIFGTPESWNKATNHKFEDRDVIYTYFVESRKERAEFMTKYKLTKVTDLKGKTGHSSPLYRASPGYYVLIMAPVTKFTCAMHPQIAKSEPGKCSICSMDLIQVVSYE